MIRGGDRCSQSGLHNCSAFADRGLAVTFLCAMGGWVGAELAGVLELVEELLPPESKSQLEFGLGPRPSAVVGRTLPLSLAHRVAVESAG